jgi:hypothetical protein
VDQKIRHIHPARRTRPAAFLEGSSFEVSIRQQLRGQKEIESVYGMHE